MPQFGTTFGPTLFRPRTISTPAVGMEEVTIARVRHLARSRRTLTDADQLYFDTFRPWVESEVELRWAAEVSEARMRVSQVVAVVNFSVAYQELSRVHPVVRPSLEAGAYTGEVANLDALGAVAYDAARCARAALALLEGYLSVWEAMWQLLSVAPSQDAAQASFRVMVRQEYERRAELKQFLSYYDDTVERVRDAYERVSRQVTIEQWLTSPASLPHSVGNSRSGSYS